MDIVCMFVALKSCFPLKLSIQSQPPPPFFRKLLNLRKQPNYVDKIHCLLSMDAQLLSSKLKVYITSHVLLLLEC